ncbi:hypothetical protein LguiB_016931 [Lonicera macranthoides]
MASSLSSFISIAIFAFVFSIFFFTLPTESTSRGHTLSRHHNAHASRTGMRVSLEHVDSGTNLTKFDRLQRAMKRGRSRLHRLNAMVLAAGSDHISSPIAAGNGEFLMKISIGTPPEPYSAIMDTGSDLIWTQCKPCKECFDSPTPVFDPEKSKSFSKMACSSSLCKALPTSSCSGGCEYMYSYGDYSSTQGLMATETFTFGKVAVEKIGFGCGDDNEGSGFSQGGGLVGLGRGPLSLVSQLGEPKFSYCLTSIDDSKSTSTLLLGSLASGVNSTSKSISTPLKKNSLQPSFYYLTLEGITVGDTKLNIEKSTFALNEDGSGGVIIDSGTTITYLEESAFDLVKEEFVKKVKLEKDDSGTTGLDLCFKLPSDSNEVEVPKFVFNFEGGDLELPGENYVIADTSWGVLCLAMGSSRGMSIIGNVQQQNLLVLHDLDKETISFTPTHCNQL